MSRIFLGDVHANTEALDTICKLFPTDSIIQLGDLGVGFTASIPYHDNLRFIRGNHDDPKACQARKDYIGDWAVDKDTLFISGAYSIDKLQRIQGYDWWPDEELSLREMDKVLEFIKEHGDTITTVVSHELPQKFIHEHFRLWNRTRTGEFLDEVWGLVVPERWYGAHHHISYHMIDSGTEFFILDELEVLKEE